MSARGGGNIAGTRSLMWVQGLICGGLLTTRPPFALLAVLLFWPVGAAALFDRAPGRPLLRSVALWSAAAGFPVLRSAWAGAGFVSIWSALGDPRTVLFVWLAGALGYGLAVGMPLLAESVAAAQRRYHAGRLRAERAALLQAWRLGPEADSTTQQAPPQTTQRPNPG